jgi:hypothetical protein
LLVFTNKITRCFSCIAVSAVAENNLLKLTAENNLLKLIAENNLLKLIACMLIAIVSYVEEWGSGGIIFGNISYSWELFILKVLI